MSSKDLKLLKFATDVEKSEKTQESKNDDENDAEARMYLPSNSRNFIVPNSDDPTMLCFTFRAVALGTFWAALLATTNAILAFRSNAMVVGAGMAVLIAYPMGVLWSKLPHHKFFNPGPFTLKEHVLVYTIASACRSPYGIDNVVANVMPEMMDNKQISFMQALAFVLITQLFGFAFSGLCRRFLVKPKGMWWPGTLSSIALFVSFHKVSTEDKSMSKFKMSRFTFFWIAFAAMFVYTWLPDYFAPVLQNVSVMCLFTGVGDGVSGVMSEVNAIASSTVTGVGLFGLTFDWQYIEAKNLTAPFWAVFVKFAGNAFFQWILTPIFYAGKAFGMSTEMRTEDLANPIQNTIGLFCGSKNSSDFKFGAEVSPTFLYDHGNHMSLNQSAYNSVKPIHVTDFYALKFATSFLTCTAVVSHVAIWYGPVIYRQFKNALKQMKDDIDECDIHNKLLRAYPDVPDWIYLGCLGVCSLGGVLLALFTPFRMPWWAVFFNIFMCVLFILPFGVIQAISGFCVTVNVLMEFLSGIILPGKTVAVMALKSWGTNNVMQALWNVQDLKLGHYLHMPPYVMFFGQLYGTFINVILSTVMSWYIIFAANSLLDKNKGDWTFKLYQAFFASGAIWGAIGPVNFFGINSVYQNLLWCFPIGFLVPFLPWLGYRYINRSKYWKWINFPLFFATKGPTKGSQNYLLMPLIMSYIFQNYVFTRHHEWFKKYTYVMGAAFDGANAFALVIISVLLMNNLRYNSFGVFNPNRANVQSDYYCYPGTTYLDHDCTYYSTFYPQDPRACGNIASRFVTNSSYVK